MYEVLFETKAERNVESLNEAFKREVGWSDVEYETMEEIEHDEQAGFLKFENGKVTVFFERFN